MATMRSNQLMEFEQAILNPARVFTRPKDVINAGWIDDSHKVRVLQTWRLDIHRKLTDATRDVPEYAEYEVLQEVNEVLGKLSNS